MTEAHHLSPFSDHSHQTFKGQRVRRPFLLSALRNTAVLHQLRVSPVVKLLGLEQWQECGPNLADPLVDARPIEPAVRLNFGDEAQQNSRCPSDMLRQNKVIGILDLGRVSCSKKSIM